MKILAALDSFKGSLTSAQAGDAVKDALLKICPEAQVQVVCLADGGEGTVDALADMPGACKICTQVTGSLETPVDVQYCICGDLAVMEMAAAAGLTLVPAHLADPLYTTTFGVGEMILDAIEKGCRRFLVGIGGSATNDGGVGMLQALGFRFLNASGEQIPRGAKGLERLCRIDVSGVVPELAQCSFRIACDVSNPICGDNGCSTVYASQKGASPESITAMDSALEHYARLVGAVSHKADPNTPGAGAAGGLGFAFLAFTNATLEQGVQIILEETDMEAHIQNADLVITGEGRLDGQSIMGKAPIGVARLAKQYQKTVLAFCGCVGEGVELVLEHGIDAYFPITDADAYREEAMLPHNALENLKNTVARVLPAYLS